MKFLIAMLLFLLICGNIYFVTCEMLTTDPHIDDTAPGSNCNETNPTGECTNDTLQVCDGSCTPARSWSCSEGEYVFVDLKDDIVHQVLQVIVYLGFSISLLACIIANIIYIITRRALKSKKCPYHIHWNLIATFTVYHVVFLIDYSVLPSCFISSVDVRNLLNVLLVYTVLANFFWMLVEGIILLCIVVLVFFTEQRGRQFIKWLILGWGSPVLLVIIWIAIEKATQPDHCTVFELKANMVYNSLAGKLCIIAPVLGMLLINGVILLVVMRSITRKLRFQACGDTTIHRRTAKSTLVLLVLLGTYYILPLIVGLFDEPPCLLALIVSSISNIISSFQGLAVSTLYVFRNVEIKRILTKRFSDLSVQFDICTTHLRTPLSSSQSSSKRGSSSTGSSSKRFSSSMGSGDGENRRSHTPAVEMSATPSDDINRNAAKDEERVRMMIDHIEDNNMDGGAEEGDGYARLENTDLRV